jgi:hypothetical protein
MRRWVLRPDALSSRSFSKANQTCPTVSTPRVPTRPAFCRRPRPPHTQIRQFGLIEPTLSLALPTTRGRLGVIWHTAMSHPPRHCSVYSSCRRKSNRPRSRIDSLSPRFAGAPSLQACFPIPKKKRSSDGLRYSSVGAPKFCSSGPLTGSRGTSANRTPSGCRHLNVNRVRKVLLRLALLTLLASEQPTLV